MTTRKSEPDASCEMIKSALALFNPEAIVYDHYDEALVGMLWVSRDGGMRCVAVYRYGKMVDMVLESSDADPGQDENERIDDAMEYINFNIVDGYLGPNTPVILHDDQLWHSESSKGDRNAYA